MLVFLQIFSSFCLEKVLLILILKWAHLTLNKAWFNFCGPSKLGISHPKRAKTAQNWPKWQIFLCKIYFSDNLPKDSTPYHFHQFSSKFIWSKFIGVLTKLVFWIFDFLKFWMIFGPFWADFGPFFGIFPFLGPKWAKNQPKFQKIKNPKHKFC